MTTPVAIYKIVNALNGRMYIGQSVNPTYRAKRHFWKNNGCIKLRNAIEKYGKDKLVAYNTGRKMSEEAKAKIAAANKTRVWTAESKAKLAASKTKAMA